MINGRDSKMGIICRQKLVQKETIFKCIGVAFVLYLVIMDCVLYVTLQHTTVIKEKALAKNVTSISVFHPLTMKLLMCNSIGHYITNPTVDIFMKVTHFSKVFFFITPNMVSVFHLILGVISGFVVSSESLRWRRWGVVIFETHRWLDGIDGALARARIGQNFHHAKRDSFGHIVDALCDITGSSALCFGVLFYLFKHFDPKQSEIPTWTKNGSPRVGYQNGNGFPRKKTIFWKTFCYGAMIGFGSWCWDFVIRRMEVLYETPMATHHLTEVQTGMLHANSTWCVVVFWRLMQGCNLVHYFAIAIITDKVWEFLNIVQYIGHLMIFIAFFISYNYIRHVRSILLL